MKHLTMVTTLVFSILVSGCFKESCSEGTVLDSKTGLPIPDARIYYGYEYVESGSLKHGQGSVLTDNGGNYSICVPSDYYTIDLIIKPGYSEAFDFHSGYLSLKPLDGIIKLKITNLTGAHDSIFVTVFNKCEYKYLYSGGRNDIKPYPLTLKQGQSHSQTVSACAGDSSNVQWFFRYIDAFVDVDSFMVKTGDTTFVELKY